MAEVFNQGRTNWCWAYAAFHIMRTYYLNFKQQDETTAEWQDAINQINSPRSFIAHIWLLGDTLSKRDTQAGFLPISLTAVTENFFLSKAGMATGLVERYRKILIITENFMVLI